MIARFSKSKTQIFWYYIVMTMRVAILLFMYDMRINISHLKFINNVFKKLEL